MWWWRKVRRANIPQELRDRFEEYGEHIMAMAISVSGKELYSQGAEITGLVLQKRGEITSWLREKADTAARREDRLETAEWAILVFVVVGVAADVAIVAHELGWLKPN